MNCFFFCTAIFNLTCTSNGDCYGIDGICASGRCTCPDDKVYKEMECKGEMFTDLRLTLVTTIAFVPKDIAMQLNWLL